MTPEHTITSRRRFTVPPRYGRSLAFDEGCGLGDGRFGPRGGGAGETTPPAGPLPPVLRGVIVGGQVHQRLCRARA